MTHALGVASGLADNGVPVRMMSGPGLTEHIAQHPSVTTEELKPIGSGPLSLLRWTYQLRNRLGHIVLENNEIGFVVIRYASSNGFMFWWLPRLYPEVSWIFEVNSLLCHQYRWLSTWFREVMLFGEAFLVARLDAVYVVSESLKSSLVTTGMISKHRILVAPNAASGQLVSMGTSRRNNDALVTESKSRPVRFTYMGIFQSYYDFELVVRAFEDIRLKNNGVELHFFGDGPLVGVVQSAVQKYADVIMHGRYDLQKLLRDGSIEEDWVLLLPYRDNSICRIGSPTKLFEYMALGRPIIASRVGQLVQVLEDGTTALFYHAGDRSSLVACMQRMIDDPASRKRMMVNVQNEFLAKHTWQARMKDFYDDLLSLPSRW